MRRVSWKNIRLYWRRFIEKFPLNSFTEKVVEHQGNVKTRREKKNKYSRRSEFVYFERVKTNIRRLQRRRRPNTWRHGSLSISRSAVAKSYRWNKRHGNFCSRSSIRNSIAIVGSSVWSNNESWGLRRARSTSATHTKIISWFDMCTFYE